MEFIINFVEENFTHELAVFILSMFPLIELKGAIPVGLSLGLGYSKSIILSYLGSLVPVPIIFFTIRHIIKFFRKNNIFPKITEKIINKSLEKGKTIKKKGLLGLFIFVAIPLPGTGVWTGTLIANLLDIRFKHAFIAIAFGNLMAGIIIFLISSGLFSVLK